MILLKAIFIEKLLNLFNVAKLIGQKSQRQRLYIMLRRTENYFIILFQLLFEMPDVPFS